MIGGHSPDTITWQCLACAEEWPCPAARDELLRWGEPSAEVTLVQAMEDAMIALPEVPSEKMLERFLGWLERTQMSRRNIINMELNLGWPVGTARACLEVEGKRPSWTVWYSKGYTLRGVQRPARFVAQRRCDDAEVVAPDAEALIAAIDLTGPRHRYTWPPGQCGCNKCY